MLRSKVAIEVHKLEEDEEGELDEYLQSPLVPCGDNLFQAGAVDVVGDNETTYGIKVRNNVNVPLHVWAFYFDCSDLTICEFYLSCLLSFISRRDS